MLANVVRVEWKSRNAARVIFATLTQKVVAEQTNLTQDGRLRLEGEIADCRVKSSCFNQLA